MARRKIAAWVAVLWLVLLGGGCGLILVERNFEDGGSERLRVDTCGKWRYYDRNSTKEDDRNLMLKNEITF
jgi:hypothetical protein